MLITDPCSPLARPWWWWANGMPPLWQYLWPLGSRAHCCPQRAWTPDPASFPLQTGRFQGTAEGAMIAIVDPGEPMS
jgi:hypothetical protein